MKSLLATIIEKSGSLIAAIYLGVTALQFVVGTMFDLALSIIFIAILVGRLKLKALQEWLDKK